MTEVTSPHRVDGAGVHNGLPLSSAVRQIDGLQVLRAIAVILVVWPHAGQQLHDDQHKELPNLGVYGIDIFFAISGFILGTVVSRSKETAGLHAAWQFLKRRWVRIFPIFWLFCIPALLLMVRRHHPVTLQYLPNLFLLPSWTYPKWEMFLDVSWTLIFEMFFYTMFACVQVITVRRALPVAIALFSLLATVGTVIRIHMPFLIVICNPILWEFTFGICVAVTFKHYGLRRWQGAAMVLVALAATVPLMMFANDSGRVANGMQMVQQDAHVFARVTTWGSAAAVLIAGMVFWSPSPRNKLWIILIAVGNSSYSTYLASTIVLNGSITFFMKFLHEDIPFSDELHLGCQIAATAITLGAGWLCYRFVEWPLVRSLQRRLHLGR